MLLGLMVGLVQFWFVEMYLLLMSFPLYLDYYLPGSVLAWKQNSSKVMVTSFYAGSLCFLPSEKKLWKWGWNCSRSENCEFFIWHIYNYYSLYSDNPWQKSFQHLDKNCLFHLMSPKQNCLASALPEMTLPPNSHRKYKAAFVRGEIFNKVFFLA